MEKHIAGFAPVAHRTARVLVLGSMPGKASLVASQYYAHPRNAFWKIMAELTGLAPDASYDRRLEVLTMAGIALWDVLHSCKRQGSLDSAIESGSIKTNDFRTFFRGHPHIKQVCFNGAVAEHCYRKIVLPGLETGPIRYLRLPSTSPAHAALSFEEKLAAWRIAIGIDRR